MTPPRELWADRLRAAGVIRQVPVATILQSPANLRLSSQPKVYRQVLRLQTVLLFAASYRDIPSVRAPPAPLPSHNEKLRPSCSESRCIPRHRVLPAIPPHEANPRRRGWRRCGGTIASVRGRSGRVRRGTRRHNSPCTARGVRCRERTGPGVRASADRRSRRSSRPGRSGALRNRGGSPSSARRVERCERIAGHRGAVAHALSASTSQRYHLPLAGLCTSVRCLSNLRNRCIMQRYDRNRSRGIVSNGRCCLSQQPTHST